MKNGKCLLMIMVICGTVLFGCAPQDVNKVEEPNVKQEEVTESVAEVEEAVEVEEQPKAEYENGIWGDSKPNYEDLQTTKIELVKNSDDEVIMIYNGTIQNYADDVTRETTGDCVDYELTSQLLMVAFCSMDEAEVEFTLVDNEGTVIYSYLDGEPVVNGLEDLR